jgi:cytoskeleton protein RodZ
MSEAGNQDLGELPSRVGARLKQAREAQSLALETIAERTRVPIRHLQKIEAGDHVGLPAIPYSAGFVKIYAQMLGLDGIALSRDFREELGQVSTRHYPEPFAPADPARVPSRALALIALGVALFLAVAYLFWRGGGGVDDPVRMAAEPDAPAVPGATSAPAANPAPAAPVAGPVVLTATEQVWVKIYEMNGPTLFMGLMEPGQRFAVPATATDPRILTGRPDVIRVAVGDRAIPPLGTAEQTIKDVSLKAPSLIERMGTAPAVQPLVPLVPPPADNVAAPPA